MKNGEKLFKVLADKNRLRILKLLEKRAMCVCELAKVIGITQPSVSRHLKKLKVAGLVCDKQAGFWTDYYLCCPCTSQQAALLKQILRFLDDEKQVNADRRAALKADRSRLCCKSK